jgi:hypothetical protein
MCYATGVRRLALISVSAIVFAGVACASQSPPPAASPTEQQGQNDVRPHSLTTADCTSLVQWIAEACHDRANMDRSSQAEGWCSDMTRVAAEGGSWIDDCAKHVKEIDAACIRSTTKVRSMMDCDANVDRTQ